MVVVVKLIEMKNLDDEKLMAFLAEHEGCQVFNSEFFVGKKQVLHAVNEMKRAFREGINFSSKEELEFLVRFLGERQINKAVKKAKPGKHSVFVSWKNSARNYNDFKKLFEFRVLKMRKPKEKELKEAIEKTASFWI